MTSPDDRYVAFCLALALAGCGAVKSAASKEPDPVDVRTADADDARLPSKNEAASLAPMDPRDGGLPSDDVATLHPMDAGPFACGAWGASLLSLSANASLMAGGFADGIVTIHKSNLDIIRQFQAHDTVVRAVVLSTDGTLVATATDAGEIRLWSAANTSRVGTLTWSFDPSTDQAPSLSLSPDNRFLAALVISNPPSGTTTELLVFDVAAGKLAWSVVNHDSPMQSVYFVDGGASLLVVRNEVTVYRRTDGTVLRTGTTATLPAPDVSSPAECPLEMRDTTELLQPGPTGTVVVADIAGRIRLAESCGGQASATWLGRGQWGEPATVRFSPNGSLVATQAYYSGGYQSLVVWDAASQTVAWSLSDLRLESRSHPPAHAFAFSSDGQYAFAISADGSIPSDTSIRMLGAQDGRVVKRFGPGAACVAPSADGTLVYACGSSKGIDVYRVADGVAMPAMDASIATNELAVSPDGTLLAAAFTDYDNRKSGLALYRLSDGKQLWKQNEDAIPNPSVDAPSITFSPDGRMLALARRSVSGLRLYDALSGALTLVAPSDVGVQADFSSDSRFLFAGTEKRVDLIRLSDRKVLATLPGSGGVAVSPVSDRLLVGGWPRQITAFCGVLASLDAQP